MPTTGTGPVGRYGHAVTLVGSKFFVFGGQVDGEFFNDLWAFDLNTCASFYCSPSIPPLTTASVRTRATWELIEPATPEKPAQRTGHACVTYQDRIIMYVAYSPIQATPMLTLDQLWRNRRLLSLQRHLVVRPHNA